MKTVSKITFGDPRFLPSAIDGIEFLFPYQIQTILKDSPKPDSFSTPKLKYVKASISGSMAINWGFQIWRSETEYDDLKKLFFFYVRDLIKEKIKEGTLKDEEHVIIVSSTHPPKKIYNAEESPEIFGHMEEIEITSDDELI